VGTAALENYNFPNEALKKIRAIIPPAKHDIGIDFNKKRYGRACGSELIFLITNGFFLFTLSQITSAIKSKSQQFICLSSSRPIYGLLAFMELINNGLRMTVLTRLPFWLPGYFLFWIHFPFKTKEIKLISPCYICVCVRACVRVCVCVCARACGGAGARLPP
jgi:hypothetical protein